MKNVFEKAFTLLIGNDLAVPTFKISKKRPFRELTLRELIQLESQIGAKLFGPILPGNRREFFNEDHKNWIWHEEQKAPNGKITAVTTRYEVHAEGILKVQDGSLYHYIKGEELQNLSIAVEMYHERVMREIYKRDPQTGKLTK